MGTTDVKKGAEGHGSRLHKSRRLLTLLVQSCTLNHLFVNKLGICSKWLMHGNLCSKTYDSRYNPEPAPNGLFVGARL